ncbi:MAG: matrixin family metalloprotease [Phycisphaerales bacterium]
MFPAQLITATLLSGGLLGGAEGESLPVGEVDVAPPRVSVWHCETEPFGIIVRGGGMINDGWDGPGANTTTLYWFIENYSPDLPAGQQRAAYILAMAAWASVVRITFVEIAAPNHNRSIDLRFASGDHCAIEADECGDPDCPFDGPTGVLAHAAFPIGGQGTCGPASTESRAGNVHFDEAELWEQDNAGSGISLTLIAAHEIGHALGLLHDTGPGGPHIMRPLFNGGEGMQNPSASDIGHLRSGYAAGVGSVITLESSGIWVNSAWLGPEFGTPGEPFDTIGEGVNALPPQNGGITIHVLGGLYPGAVTISQPCTITSEFSTAFIGQ